MSERKENVILVSGGIDSTIAYYFLDKPQPIYFNLNSRYSDKELKYLPNLIDNKHNLIIDNSLKFLGDLEQDLNAHIPYRNLYLAMTATAKYANTVYIIGVQDDNMTDKNKKIFKEWSVHLSKLEERNIAVKSPFWNKTKADIVKWFVENVDNAENILLDTVSCYDKSLEKYCGKCQACFRKAVALYSVEIKLPFYSKEVMDYYYNRIGKKIYNKQREENMLEYINYIRSTK